MSLPKSFEDAFQRLRQASTISRSLTSSQKNQLLEKLADHLLGRSKDVLEANKKDLLALSEDTTSAFRDRLTLDPKRLEGMAESLRAVAGLSDPVGELVEQRTLPNGLHIRRERAPLGVIFMIFESRPNVILEAFSLAFKSGNAIALRGGSDSKETAKVMYAIMREALALQSLPIEIFLGIDDYDRTLVTELLARNDLIDVVVPRGGDRLIEFVVQTARMPIIKNDRGLCHAYIDDLADIEMATNIVLNGKIQRPGVCNSLETVLVHRSIAKDFVPKLYNKAKPTSMQWHCDPECFALLQNQTGVTVAQSKDWDTEYLDLILNCKVVANMEEALEHIARHGSKHSEVIVTASEERARKFQSLVDAAAVYWNASTRFTDGFELGLGGELGISTQKLHVRGPVGLRELTTPRWIIDGQGQIRP